MAETAAVDTSAAPESAKSTAKSIQDVTTVASAESNKTLNLPSCFLIYETESHGQLVAHYSKTYVENAVGVLEAEKIPSFKYNAPGRYVLIGNCSGGKQGRKKFCSGWVQFVKTAAQLSGSVKVNNIPADVKALAVDVYFFTRDEQRGEFRCVKLEPGKFYSTEKVLAVACLPRNSEFYDGLKIDEGRFMHDGNDKGYAAKL